MRFAYNVIESGTERILGGGISKEGLFDTAHDYMAAEILTWQAANYQHLNFDLVEISEEEYRRITGSEYDD